MPDVKQPAMPSERSFGLLMGGVLIVTAIGLLYQGHRPQSLASAIAALAVGLSAWRAPFLLRAPNRAWFALGQALHRIVSPLVLGVIFFAVLTPTALLARVAGRDILRVRPGARDRPASYWIERDPPGPSGDSLRRPF